MFPKEMYEQYRNFITTDILGNDLEYEKRKKEKDS